MPLKRRVERKRETAQAPEVPVRLGANEHMVAHLGEGVLQRSRALGRDRAHELEVDLEDTVTATGPVDHLIEEAEAHAFVVPIAKAPGPGRVQCLDLPGAGRFMVEAAVVKDEHGIVGEEANINLEAGDASCYALIHGFEGVWDVAPGEGGAMAAEGTAAPENHGCEWRTVVGMHSVSKCRRRRRNRQEHCRFSGGTARMSPMDAELEVARFRIYALQDGAIRAQALAYALSIGFFDRLDRAPMTRGEIEAEFGLASRVAPAFLAFLASNSLIALGPDGTFRNTEAASAFLVRSSPRYVGGRGLLFQGFYDAIAHLPETLASGRAWTPAGQHDMFAGFTADQQRWFADGMFANAVHGGRSLAEVVDFTMFRRLLDVGGNAGGYAIGLARANPRLQATIFDLEPVRELAIERIAAAGLDERIEFVAGSFFEEELPRGHDALLLSSILHDWDDADCARILARCYRAIEPGGTIIVAEPMLSEDATGPDHPAASGLTMALLGGENRTRSRIAQMLAEAGFGKVWRSALLPQNSVVTAIREG